MPVVPPALFDEAVDRAIRDNVDYIPPYGYGGAMYLRPFLFGHGEKLGLGAAPHYTFCVIASPVGAYYKGGLQPIDALVIDEFDRAAPRGVGGIKCAGNYAPDVLPSIMAKERGFPVCLYLDAATQVCFFAPQPKLRTSPAARRTAIRLVTRRPQTSARRPSARAARTGSRSTDSHLRIGQPTLGLATHTQFIPASGGLITPAPYSRPDPISRRSSRSSSYRASLPQGPPLPLSACPFCHVADPFN
jgi:hypothetical protein